ncbi:prefoldin subunit [bacterium]|nr:prefoldin subunit [bacterium]
MMTTNTVILVSNVGKSQIRDTGTHWEIKNIPVTVDGAVMNGILYPANENAKGLKSLINKPVTLSHPVDEKGNLTTGREGAGLMNHFSGGTITNVYNVRGVNYADATIKKGVLQGQEDGEWYVNALDSRADIGVSTGLLIAENKESGVTNGEKYDSIAKEQNFDHLAMLTDKEPPAGGDATFMRFNAETENAIVVNVADHMPEQTLLNKALDAVKALFAANDESRYNDANQGHTAETNGNHKEVANVDKKKMEALMKNMGKTDEEIANMDEDAMYNAFSDFTKKKDKPEAKPEEDEEKMEKNSSNEALELAVNKLLTKVEDLETKLTANAQNEIDTLAEAVSKLATNALPLEQAKKLDADFLKSHLAANGHINVNSAGGYEQRKTSSVADMKMPGAK